MKSSFIFHSFFPLWPKLEKPSVNHFSPDIWKLFKKWSRSYFSFHIFATSSLFKVVQKIILMLFLFFTFSASSSDNEVFNVVGPLKVLTKRNLGKLFVCQATMFILLQFSRLARFYKMHISVFRSLKISFIHPKNFFCCCLKDHLSFPTYQIGVGLRYMW